MPFYVSPEQAMKDKADYARKGIARGRSGVVIQYDAGILFVAPNPSRALHKISEIYDRIAFAAVGRYNEYEILRKAGVRYADMTGYQYDRQDVTARGLANWYAQTLGTIFTDSPKPFEVEIVVAEVGRGACRGPDLPDHLRRVGQRRARLRGDGRPGRGHRHRAQGAVRGQHDPVGRARGRHRRTEQPRPTATRSRSTAGQLEVAVLDRTRDHRTFRRLTGARLESAAGRGRHRPKRASAAEHGQLGAGRHGRAGRRAPSAGRRQAGRHGISDARRARTTRDAAGGRELAAVCPAALRIRAS